MAVACDAFQDFDGYRIRLSRSEWDNTLAEKSSAPLLAPVSPVSQCRRYRFIPADVCTICMTNAALAYYSSFLPVAMSHREAYGTLIARRSRRVPVLSHSTK